MKLEEAIKSIKFRSQAQKAMLNVLYSAWCLKTVFSKELKHFSLTHEQFNVLRILKGMHPNLMCVKDIGCRMIEKSSNVPRIIDRLETKKLVERSISGADKRETLIKLTNNGLNLLNDASAKLDDVSEAYIGLTEQEAILLNDLLEKSRTKA